MNERKYILIVVRLKCETRYDIVTEERFTSIYFGYRVLLIYANDGEFYNAFERRTGILNAVVFHTNRAVNFKFLDVCVTFCKELTQELRCRL